MKLGHYSRLSIMVVLSFAAMYALMYSMDPARRQLTAMPLPSS